MSGSKARHGTLKACATSPGRQERFVWDSLRVVYSHIPGNFLSAGLLFAAVKWNGFTAETIAPP